MDINFVWHPKVFQIYQQDPKYCSKGRIYILGVMTYSRPKCFESSKNVPYKIFTKKKDAGKHKSSFRHFFTSEKTFMKLFYPA